MNNLAQIIINKILTDVPRIMSDLQQERFANQGQFNDNPKWVDNAQDVINDKGHNQPMVDSGNLEKELSNPKNWDLNPSFTNNTLKLSIPEYEKFTEPKYDILETGGYSPSYISKRGNKMKAREIPAREFKKISDMDFDWIVDKLVQDLKSEFE